MEILIRRAEKSDAADIGAVHYRAWIETYAGLLPDAYLATRSSEKSAELFSRTECKNLAVAECDGMIVGFCGWGKFRTLTEAAMGEVQGIYLLDAYKHRGIGRWLMDYALEQLRTAGARQVGLWVLDTNAPAIAFYEKLGFRYTGRCKAENLGALVTEKLYTKNLTHHTE